MGFRERRPGTDFPANVLTALRGERDACLFRIGGSPNSCQEEFGSLPCK